MTNFLTKKDVRLYHEGKHYHIYDKLGAHFTRSGGQNGVHFAVWAPNAAYMAVMGEWNDWSKKEHPMDRFADSGIWTCFIPGIQQGQAYKYFVHSQYKDFEIDKADPFAFATELVPQTASRVWDISGYEWKDEDWIANRAQKNAGDAPMNIYEMHLGSWVRDPEKPESFYSYRELAPRLCEYLNKLHYTHIEFLPVMEHPFYGSWGYQTIAYYAPSSRYGTPQDFMYLIDELHQAGIGVLLDWVPSHFPQDGHGLVYFDGTWLYEHADPRKGLQMDWGTYIFNYGRPEVSNFLLSNALFWIEKYHVDGLRLDAVASMLYLDYSRKPGEWVPNKHGGRENLESIDFLRHVNHVVHEQHPGVLMIAEESTSWPMVSRPVHLGGLGFDMKWNMGWMHDTLDYMEKDPIHRSYHHGKMTFGIWYAWSENFILPFSHDEVVHLKKSMLSKMPGDLWRQFANLRLLYGFMTGHPGKKLLFMGGEFGQWREWNHDRALDWELLNYTEHQQLHSWVQDLNRFYRNTPALYELDFEPRGFQWIDCNDNVRSVLSFLRFGKNDQEAVAFICNFTPVPRHNYRIGVPWEGIWEEALNSDSEFYGGSGIGNFGSVKADEMESHGRKFSVNLQLPPLSVVILKSSFNAETLGRRENSK
ncbi:1,4-alpha-glucan branching protein GlgB [bacterium]|nr:1,4-alpha-glucan branching protein GlgB [bacterium]